MKGFHVTTEAPGAHPNGSIVEKSVQEPGDAHPIGARARVLGSVGPVEDGTIGYFVEWKDMPGIACLVGGPRIRLLATSFTCPKCGATSHNPNDLREGYCGRCHEWTRAREPGDHPYVGAGGGDE
jgi:ribosomal protein S27AE